MLGQQAATAAGGGSSPRSAGRALLRRAAPRMPLHLAVIGLAALWSIPTIALLISSFRDPTAIAASGWWNAVKEPFDFTVDNYSRVLEQRGMARAFFNSVIISVPVTIFVILVAALAAYAFAWMRFPGRNMLFLVMVALLVVPLQMTLIPVLRLYTNFRCWAGTSSVSAATPAYGRRTPPTACPSPSTCCATFSEPCRGI